MKLRDDFVLFWCFVHSIIHKIRDHAKYSHTILNICKIVYII